MVQCWHDNIANCLLSFCLTLGSWINVTVCWSWSHSYRNSYTTDYYTWSPCNYCLQTTMLSSLEWHIKSVVLPSLYRNFHLYGQYSIWRMVQSTNMHGMQGVVPLTHKVKGHKYWRCIIGAWVQRSTHWRCVIGAWGQRSHTLAREVKGHRHWLIGSVVRYTVHPEEDGQGQKVLIIDLHPEDFNWIPIIYSSFSTSN